MKISLNWLRDFLDLPADLDGQAIGKLLTAHTAEVESVEDLKGKFARLFVGTITAIAPHPNADKLRIVQVDLGGEANKTIVCGADNVSVGMKVVVALSGAMVRWHGEGEPVEIKDCKIRGQMSEGMICAAEEIGVESVFKPVPEGVLDLSESDCLPGSPFTDIIGADTVLEIDNKSLTHRPDLWGHYGFARELSAILNLPLKQPTDSPLPPCRGERKAVINIASDTICPRFSAVIVGEITVADSPAWLRERLSVLGLNSINNVVDVTNYVMLELGQPLHAYDRTLIPEDVLNVRAARTGEKITLLDGGERLLQEGDPLVTDNNDHPLGLAGIKGGLSSGVSPQTTTIILEAANWNPVLIRKTSQHHGLRTDASQRFEKSLDPLLTEAALQRAVELLLRCCPKAHALGPIHTQGAFRSRPLNLKISTAEIQSKIGAAISEEEIVSLLKRLQFKVNSDKKQLTVEVPSFRATKDIGRAEDLVEEVARLHGYDRIPSLLPRLNVKLPPENHQRRRSHEARLLLAWGLGFSEINTYSYLGAREIENCLLSLDDHIDLENFLSEDQSHLRLSLVPNLIKAIEFNCRHRESFRLFDLGRSFQKQTGRLPLQEKLLAAACVLEKKSPLPAFYQAKGAAENFLSRFTTQKVDLKKSVAPPPYAHPEQCLNLIVADQIIGHVFTLHPLVARNWGIENPCALFELNFSRLLAGGETVRRYQAVPRFPAARFDISVVVDEAVTVGDLTQALLALDPILLRKAELFDIYRHPERIGTDKKALAFQITLQAEDRTLSEEETSSLIERAIALLNGFGKVRGQ